MHINFLLTSTILIGIGYAAMSSDDITKCLGDIATQFSDADTQAQKIDLVSFIGLQPQIMQSYTIPTNRERDCGEQLSAAQEAPSYDAEQQQQICSAYKSSVQSHRSFFNTLITKKTTITSYGAGPQFADLVSEDRKAHDAFTTGISNAVPECVQDVAEAKGALDPDFDEAYSAFSA